MDGDIKCYDLLRRGADRLLGREVKYHDLDIGRGCGLEDFIGHLSGPNR